MTSNAEAARRAAQELGTAAIAGEVAGYTYGLEVLDNQPELEHQKKQEKQLQLQVERLNQVLQNEEPKKGSDGNEIQSNVVDNQSVKMPTSHGVIQGYNAQALVDSKHQVILAAEAFSSQDHENLAPMLTGAKKNMHTLGKEENYFHGKHLTADSNYHSYESLTLCKSEGLDAYIPDIQFRKRDGCFAQQQRFKDGIHPRSDQAKTDEDQKGNPDHRPTDKFVHENLPFKR